MRQVLAAGIAASIALAACGGTTTEQPAKQVEKAASDIKRGAETAAARGVEGMAKGFEDLARGLNAMAGRDPNRKPVDPLSIDALKSALPEVPGWEKGKPLGERMMNPVNYAEARVTFTKGDSRIDVKIVDSALNQMLVAPFAMFLAVGYEKETDRGYEKGVKIGEHPGWEKWDAEDRDGELNAIIDDRFIVQIEGRQIDSMKVLHAVMDSTNLKKLADSK
jgi:hypothetical protein